MHTPLPVPAIITKNGVEPGQVIGLHLTGELYDWQMVGTEQRVGSNPEVEPGVSKSNPEVLIYDGYGQYRDGRHAD